MIKLIKGKRTWFDRESNKWVSELPKAFWTGLIDCYTGDKLFSNDKIYCYFAGKWTRMNEFPITNPVSYVEFYGFYPHYIDFGYRFTKTPYNK